MKQFLDNPFRMHTLMVHRRPCKGRSARGNIENLGDGSCWCVEAEVKEGGGWLGVRRGECDMDAGAYPNGKSKRHAWLM